MANTWLARTLSSPRNVKSMNKKIILGLLSTCIVAFSLGVFVFYVKRDGGDRKFTLRLEPEEITLRVGEYRNLTINIVSTGYEGDVAIFYPNYTFTGEESQTALEYQIIPGSGEPNARFLEADGKLTLTLRIRWTGSTGTLYLNIAAYGNYQGQNEFKVLSNSVKIRITLPY